MPRPSDPHTDLLLDAQRGDRGAFERLIDRTRARLTRQLQTCRLTRGIGEDLDDALAEGVLAAWKALKSYRPDLCSAEGWLWILTRNATVSLLRSRTRWGVSCWSNATGTVGDPGSVAFDPAAQVAAKEEVEHLRCLVERVVADAGEDKPKQAFRLWCDGVPYAQIARELHVKFGTVASWIHRLRRECRAALVR